ncbi:tetratricopeptide repeat protein 21B-like isoform X2 [Salvelinus fontinalis]|uniref:tetratricopeptide repeat protein 21B-like isoform X2 n=1 Tax=Salvelinus fontinalis TaxID=8038 RepID=UPI0024854712|nr:tetratricopeptide repeat protein 21B-like isoform X2 [Salvelinus fontinalis]
MADTDPVCLASLVYFMGEKFYRQSIHTAEYYLKTYHDDPVLLFFKGFGILMEGRTQEAMRELEQVKDKPTVAICSRMALICAHKQSDMIDDEAVSALKTHVRNIRKTAGEQPLFYGALFLWLTGHVDKAKDYIDKILKISKSSKEGSILKGWVDMNSEDEFQRNNAICYLDGGGQHSRDVFGMMGKAKYFMNKHNFTGSQQVVNQIVTSHSDFLPGLMLKMKLFLALQDWEQALDTAARILQQDGRNLKAIQVLAIHTIVRDGDLVKAKEHLQALVSAAEVSEPCSPSLHVSLTQPISRLCGGNPDILQLLTPFTERAYSKGPGNADVANEMGYLLSLQKKTKEATRWYSAALNLDTSSVPALAGLIRCQLMDGQLQEAANQLEFLREIHQSIGQSAELVLLQALLLHKRGAGLAVISPLLKEATDLHFLDLRGRPMGPDYFHRLHPDFIFQVVNLYLSFFQEKPLTAGQPVPFGLSHSGMVLQPVVKMAPGLLPGAYHMAHVTFLSGDSQSAQQFLDFCLERDPTIAEVHLLQSRIHLHEGDYNLCFQSLETGVSHNFQVLDFAQYHQLKARALRGVGKLEEAIKSLKMAMGIHAASVRESHVSNRERVSVFLELAEALRLHGEPHESTMVLQDAIAAFAGTPEEICVTIANVDMALAKDDLDTALSVLRGVTPDQTHYTAAKEKMALIYLQRRKDKKLYIACYREIRDELPGPQSSILLGDAYINIQEPERAVEVYQEALRGTARDATLWRKMGQAHVKTHQYNQAVRHYESAVKLGGHDSLVVDLVELLLKLRQYGKAQRTLMTALHCDDGTLTVSSLMSNVQYFLLLARAHYADQGSVQDTLEKAHSVQERVQERCQTERPELLEQERTVLCSICCQLARHYRTRTDVDRTKYYYNQAIVAIGRTDYKISLELAQFYLENGKTDEAMMQVEEVLGRDALLPDATMVYGDIKLKEEKFEESVEIYLGLMGRCPDNFVFLAKCIQVLRWSARLDDALALFQACEHHNHGATTEPGYNYCKGLYYWHVYRVSEALFHLNKARRDNEWGDQALELMIRICLNPDNEVIGGEVFETPQEEWSMSQLGGAEHREQVGVATAQNLVKEFRPRQGSDGGRRSDRITLLVNLCFMATRDPKHIQRALQVFTELASTKVNNVPYLLAMGQAFMLLKQTPRARNQLKRLTKVEWSWELSESLETAWLLLADVYIKSGKYDVACDLLHRCVKYNQSCSRAYEYMGYIREKEQSYHDASVFYGHAWLYTNRVNPSMGFRLAFNYLKFKQYNEAIEVCHKVLTEHPDYPLIQTEVLERARSALRP